MLGIVSLAMVSAPLHTQGMHGTFATALRARLGQRLVDVPQDVVDVLQPDRDAHHVGQHAGGELLRFVELAVRGAWPGG